jgi:FlaA1/EpsC-like NDP-sugar epimerase
MTLALVIGALASAIGNWVFVWLWFAEPSALVLYVAAGVDQFGHGLAGTVFVIYLSMLVSPWLIGRADWLAMRVSSQEWMMRSLQLSTIAARSLSRDRHVIICGYGRSGQSLAHILEAENVSFVALDLDPDRVREAASAGEAVVYGDSTRRETLLAAGVHRASVLVVTYEGFRRESLRHLLLTSDLGCVVLDEGQRLRNPDTEVAILSQL